MTFSRTGRQEPTTAFILPYSNSVGADAIDLYELSGKPAEPWQELLAYDLLAVGADGKWIHTRFGYSIPRRNGKGELLIIRELYGLMIGEKILHTAHLTSTSHSAWERLCTALDAIGIQYSYIRAKGSEYIRLRTGGYISFRTRTSKGGLGEGYDLLVIDEAQEYKTDQESALKYVVTDSQNPQTILCGTPPTPVSSGTVFRDFRKSVLAGEKERAGWAEWSVEQKSDVYNRDLWYETNPSLGYHLDENQIADEIGDDEIDFNIQRLGLWIKYNLKSAISKVDWENCRVEVLPKLVGKISVGIKFNKNGETVSLAVAGRTDDDNVFVEVVENRHMRDGIAWIMDFLKTLGKNANKIIIDGKNGQTLIEEELKKAKIRYYVFPKVTEYIAANAAFEQNIFQRRIRHMEQGALTQAVTNCEKRAIGSHGGFGYQSISAVADQSLMDAVILAAWAVDEYKQGKKQVAGY